MYALLGDQTNYSLGYWFGRDLFKKLPFISDKNIERAENFYDKYGAKTIIFGRYVPIVRTLIPFTAAVVHPHYRPIWNYCTLFALIWGK